MARLFFRLTTITMALAFVAGCGSDSTSPQTHAGER